MFARTYHVAIIMGGVSRNSLGTKPCIGSLDVLQAWRDVEPFHTNCSREYETMQVLSVA